MSPSPPTEAPPLTRRARLRQATIDEIKTIAGRQLAEAGPSALSLRAIAREMGMASSAIYRYFAGHDELIGAMCVDAYDAIADALAAARDGNASDDHAGRIADVFRAYRQWSIGHPAEFALIFGTPVPGFAASAEVTGPAAGRFSAVLGEAYADAVRDGAAEPERTEIPASFQLGEAFAALLTKPAADYPPRLAGIVINAWASVRGFVTMEVFGSLDLLVADPDALFDAHLRAVLLGMGFPPDGEQANR